MNHPKWNFPKFIVFSSLFTLIFSCQYSRDIPFPENASGYEIPVSQAFTMPEGESIDWKIFPKDSIPEAVTIRLDLEKLPSKPFSVNEFKPLRSPLSSTSFDWDKLKSIPFKLDSLDGSPVKVKKFMLPSPQISGADLPAVWNGGTSAIIRLGQSEGMLGNKIFAMVQDNFGSTWISSERGLTKYTGAEFYTYNFFGKNENGSIEVIADLGLDSSGRLIISALNTGIYRLDITLGIVEHFLTNQGYIRIAFDDEGILWCVNRNVFLLDLENKTISMVDLQRENPNENRGFGVKMDKEGNIWIGFGQKIGILDAARKSIRFIGDEEGLAVQTAYEFTEDKTGNVWITAFSTDAFGVSLHESKIRKMGADQGYFGRTTDVFEDHLDRLWFVSNDTVTIYDPAKNAMKKVLTGSPIRTIGFPSSSMLGKDGEIWVGTDKDGVLILDPKGLLAENFSSANGLESNDVWGVEEDSKGRIWMATYRGINIYDPAKERLYTLKLPAEVSTNDFRQIYAIGQDVFLAGIMGGFAIIDLKANAITHYNTTKEGTANAIFNGIKSTDGRIWLGTGSGLLVFDPSENSLKSLSKSNGLVSNTSYVVIQDRKGRIWVCSDSGVNVIDPKANINVTLQKKEGLLSDYNSMIIESETGEIIIGGDLGISIFDFDQNMITNVSAINGLIPPTLYDMTEVNGRIHIGSENGIIVVNRPTAYTPGQHWHFSNYGKSSGIPYNDYNQSTAFPTKSGQVWWGAAPILTVVHQDPISDTIPPTVRIKGMNIMDQNPVFLKSQLVKNELEEGDSLWHYNTSEVYTPQNFPLDSGYLFDNKIQWDSITAGFQMPINLRLPYDQNSFNFSFVNQSVIGRDRIVYKYILEGEEEEWSDISPKPISRIYYNLSPGEYAFKVASKGFNGIWSEPVSLDFVILPPWWQTWWAYMIFIAFFGGSVYAAVYVRSQYLKKENRILEEKVNHRTAQLKKSIDDLKATQSQLIQSEKMASLGELTAGIAHEIQNPLNFVNNFSEVSNELIEEIEEERAKIQSERDETLVTEILVDIRQNLQKIHHHGKRADGIVKGMLQHSRAGTGKKEPTDLNAMADEYLRLAYHGLRAKDKSFSCDFETKLDPMLPKLEVISQEIGRVFLNLINNAFYAVNAKSKALNGSEPDADFYPMVTVSSQDLSETIEIKVTDNGCGIPKDIIDKIFHPFFTTKPTGQGTGLGLSLSYDIIRSHGGEFTVESREGLGTEFIIQLPKTTENNTKGEA